MREGGRWPLWFGCNRVLIYNEKNWLLDLTCAPHFSIYSFVGYEVRGSCFPCWSHMCSGFAGLGKCYLFSSRFWSAQALLIFLLKSWSSFSCSFVFGPASRALVRISVYPFAGWFFSQELLTPIFRPLLWPWFVFMWLVFGLEHRLRCYSWLSFRVLVCTTGGLLLLVFFALWDCAAHVFLISSCSKPDSYFTASRFGCSCGQFASGLSSTSRVHRLDSAARSQLPPSFVYPVVGLLSSFLAPGITWFCVSGRCSCKSSVCFESVAGGGRSCSWATASKARVFLVLFVLRS
jgi:hypothetical protein